jgi:Mycothiol maleylpyruvate isomerase N-terminal domain
MTDTIDLRTAPIDTVVEIDFRAPDRDFFADEAEAWERFSSSWAGLSDDGWMLPGLAPSAVGGPDWSLVDHVAHIGAWQDAGTAYIETALAGGPWPSESDFNGGDLDAWNEERRGEWAGLPPAEVRERVGAGHARLVTVAWRVPPELLAGDDDVYPWVFWVLHGHQLDHLRIIEPWVAKLRDRG